VGKEVEEEGTATMREGRHHKKKKPAEPVPIAEYLNSRDLQKISNRYPGAVSCWLCNEWVPYDKYNIHLAAHSKQGGLLKS